MYVCASICSCACVVKSHVKVLFPIINLLLCVEVFLFEMCVLSVLRSSCLSFCVKCVGVFLFEMFVLSVLRSSCLRCVC